MKKIILYGAGKIGHNNFTYLKRLHMEHMIYSFCDANYKSIGYIGDIPVLPYEQIKDIAKHNKYSIIISFNMNEQDLNFVTSRLKLDKQKWYMSLKCWLRHNKFNTSFLQNGTNRIICEDTSVIRRLKNYLSMISISGNYNVIEIGKDVELYNNMLCISGDYNHIVVEEGASILQSEIRIDDSNNSIHIGKNTYIYRDSLFAGEGTAITIGANCLFAKDVTIRSLDGHKIFMLNSEMTRLNSGKDINIGNHVWFCNGCTILKGTNLNNDIVVGANSIVNKNFPENNCVIAGAPARIIESDIKWEF